MKFEKQRTLVILKPDAVQRSLVGEILKRIEQTGLKFVAFKFFIANEDQLVRHYNKDEKWCMEKGQRIIADRKLHELPIEKDALSYGKEIVDLIVKFMTAGPVLAFVVEGNESIAVIKKLVGGTEPKTSDVGTIRGDFTVDSYDHSSVQNRAVRNLVHCSESPEEAQREIAVWFTPEEILDYKTVQERILYDVNLDGILE
jgi:nucleoside-diphosphate kinase